MVPAAILFCFMLFVTTGKAQNLVPNPSFENYTQCPVGGFNLYLASGWKIAVNTPDLLSTCDTSGLWPLTQEPLTGNAMGGFIARHVSSLHGDQEIREYLGVELLNPLTVGTKYYVSFYISLENEGFAGTNKIGARFTNTFLGDTSIVPPPFIDNYAQVYTNTIVIDTADWTLVSGSFIADSTYKYMMLGLFFDSVHTQTISISEWDSQAGYYYIDDVCVSPDSMECKTTTHAPSLRDYEYISLYPNPATGLLNVQVPFHATQLTICNSLGEVLKSITAQQGTNVVDVSNLPNGIYFLLVQGLGVSMVKRFVVGR